MRGWRITFSLSAIGHRLRSVPMLVMLVPFVAGILLYESYALPIAAVLGALGVCGLGAWLLIPRKIAWLYTATATLLLGYTIAELRAPRPSLDYDTPTRMTLRIESTPAEREGYRTAEGRIIGWEADDVSHRADDRVTLWIRSDSVGYGDEVTIDGVLKERISRFESYDRLQHRRGRVGGVGISDRNIISYHTTELRPSLQQRAIERLIRHAGDTSSYAVVEAMVAGSRRLMPASLREAYSTTGLAHLMAVSGLHLGIVAVVINLLLIPLSFVRHGHRAANLLTIVALWLFAAMSGMSPSVTRAALMLSILQLALYSSSRYSSLNALSATALLMLVYRPDYLYDISFQLSVLAVAGIILWALPVMRTTRGLHGPMRMVVVTLIIGAAATLWTLPLVSYTFGNLPIASIVLTPAVMLFAYIIIIAGIATLILPTAIASTTAAIAEWAAGLQNNIVEYAARLPIAELRYTMTEGEVVLCYATYVAITLLVWGINRKKVVTLSYDDTE